MANDYDDYDDEDPKGAGKAIAAVYDAQRASDEDDELREDMRADDEQTDTDDEAEDTLDELALADDNGEAVEAWPSSVMDADEDDDTEDPADDLDHDGAALDPMGISGIPPDAQSSGNLDDLADLADLDEDDEAYEEPDSDGRTAL